jgi:hypothetical protein
MTTSLFVRQLLENVNIEPLRYKCPGKAVDTRPKMFLVRELVCRAWGLKMDRRLVRGKVVDGK